MIFFRSNSFVICSIYSESEPYRDEYAKWCVYFSPFLVGQKHRYFRYTSYSDYPGDRYPRFCAGPGYVMSREAFEKIVAGMAKHHVSSPVNIHDVQKMKQYRSSKWRMSSLLELSPRMSSIMLAMVESSQQNT